MKPGQRVAVGGLYAVIDRRGQLSGGKCLVGAGDRLPPTPRAGRGYVLIGLRTAGAEALRAHQAVFEACSERAVSKSFDAVGG